jgi:hypothetical protein
MLVGGGDDFRILERSSGLHNGRRARFRDRVEPVSKWKERVRRRDRSSQRILPAASAFMRATLTASTRLICPAPIASVRLAVVKMTVFRLYVRAETPRKTQRRPLLRRRLSLGHDSQVIGRPWRRRLDDSIAVLHEHGAEHRAHVAVFTCSICSKSAMTTRIWDLVASTARASSSTDGAITQSIFVETMVLDVSRSIGRLRPTTAPNATADRLRGHGCRHRSPWIQSQRRTGSCA